MSAAVGMTVKSGWAAAVVVRGAAKRVEVVASQRVELSDPGDPVARQPYHDGFATMRRPGPELTRLVRSVRRFGERSVAKLLDAVRGDGNSLAGVGVVVGSLIDPSTIGNEHIRIHAMEGRLFREVVVGAAERRGLRCTVWRERDLMSAATERLALDEAALRRALADCGRAVTWRAEQKAAALAAWLVVADAR